MRFFNSTQKNMSFSDVVASIKYFIKTNPDNSFLIAVGTDSQVKGRYTCFATGIHIHMIGKGAWCCVSKMLEAKRYIIILIIFLYIHSMSTLPLIWIFINSYTLKNTAFPCPSLRLAMLKYNFPYNFAFVFT